MPNLMLMGDTSALITTTPATAAGLALIDGADAAAQRTTLGLGTAAASAASAFEAANANIQAHVIGAHAPANAQKNSDITLAEIEAKLIGSISSHSHAGGSGPTYGTATLAFGAQPGASYVTVDVTGLSGLTAASYIEAFFQGGDTTASNGADDHALAGTIIPTTCQYLTASSFRIHAMCAEGGRAWGDFKVRYAFA